MSVYVNFCQPLSAITAAPRSSLRDGAWQLDGVAGDDDEREVVGHAAWRRSALEAMQSLPAAEHAGERIVIHLPVSFMKFKKLEAIATFIN